MSYNINNTTPKYAQQWYERDPSLLGMEKIAMNRAFPNFKPERLDDGRLYWIGELNPGVYETKFKKEMKYTIVALYENNFPQQIMGSSVRVYPVLPDMDDLINMYGFKPIHILVDSSNNIHICTCGADYVQCGPDTTTSAASVVAWAVKWFTAYELYLTEDMPICHLQKHGDI